MFKYLSNKRVYPKPKFKSMQRFAVKETMNHNQVKLSLGRYVGYQKVKKKVSVMVSLIHKGELKGID